MRGGTGKQRGKRRAGRGEGADDEVNVEGDEENESTEKRS